MKKQFCQKRVEAVQNIAIEYIRKQHWRKQGSEHNIAYYTNPSGKQCLSIEIWMKWVWPVVFREASFGDTKTRNFSFSSEYSRFRQKRPTTISSPTLQNFQSMRNQLKTGGMQTQFWWSKWYFTRSTADEQPCWFLEIKVRYLLGKVEKDHSPTVTESWNVK